MSVSRMTTPFAGEYVCGDGAADRIEGGKGTDFCIGGGGADTFVFHKGDGRDYVVDFHRGEDKIEIHGSPRQISFHDDPMQGTWVHYGQFGQNGPDKFLVAHVHNLDLTDFIFV
jgi:hypothetical protein